MSNLSELIADLTAATEQMEAAALGGDWELVGRLQRRRRLIIESLIEVADREGLDEGASERLKTIRHQESGVAALAEARLAALRRALAELPAAQAHRLSRMERAYRDGGAI